MLAPVVPRGNDIIKRRGRGQRRVAVTGGRHTGGDGRVRTTALRRPLHVIARGSTAGGPRQIDLTAGSGGRGQSRRGPRGAPPENGPPRLVSFNLPDPL